MATQIESPDGKPRKDKDRPSPDVDGYEVDGQSPFRGTGASDEQARPPAGRKDPNDPNAVPAE